MTNSDLKKENGIGRSIRSRFEAAKMSAPPGAVPTAKITEILSCMNEREAVEKFERFMDEYILRLDDPPRTWKHVVESLKNWTVSALWHETYNPYESTYPKL